MWKCGICMADACVVLFSPLSGGILPELSSPLIGSVTYKTSTPWTDQILTIPRDFSHAIAVKTSTK
jgi:hypothetical protein